MSARFFFSSFSSLNVTITVDYSRSVELALRHCILDLACLHVDKEPKTNKSAQWLRLKAIHSVDHTQVFISVASLHFQANHSEPPKNSHNTSMKLARNPIKRSCTWRRDAEFKNLTSCGFSERRRKKLLRTVEVGDQSAEAGTKTERRRGKRAFRCIRNSLTSDTIREKRQWSVLKIRAETTLSAMTALSWTFSLRFLLTCMLCSRDLQWIRYSSQFVLCIKR